MALDHQKIEAWTDWLQRYYPRGNTVRNKCQHMSSFLTFLETVEGYGDDAKTRCKIDQCRSITNNSAQDAKILGIQQRASLANDEALLSKGMALSFVSLSLSLFSQLLTGMCVCVCVCVCEWLHTGKMLEDEEAKVAFQWLCQKWSDNLHYFLPPAADKEQAASFDEDTLFDRAFYLQRLLMARLFYLGGGQRRQIYAGMLLGDISWKKGKMVLWVPAEKVARLNTNILPLPPQLWTSIEFFKQSVRPHLLTTPGKATNKKHSFWINASSGALEPYQFSDYICETYKEFNLDLNIMPINFRRMTATGLVASMYPPSLSLSPQC